MHYYQFNIGDYASHTSHLDEIEDIAYRRMIDYCYLNEIGLPESVSEISRLIRMRSHCESIANVLREFFFQDSEGWWKCPRVEKEILAYREKSDKAAKAARKRWDNADANALPAHSERNANQEPRTNNQEPITKNQDKPARKSSLITFSEFVESCSQSGEKPIPEDDPIFDYCKKINLPPQYLSLAWLEFKAYYSDKPKKYKDWRQVFRNAVKANWYKLWFLDNSQYQLTTRGKQAELASRK